MTDKKNEAQLPTRECLRCGHVWVARKLDIRVCPKCNTPYWNRPKKVAKSEV